MPFNRCCGFIFELSKAILLPAFFGYSIKLPSPNQWLNNLSHVVYCFIASCLAFIYLLVSFKSAEKQLHKDQKMRISRRATLSHVLLFAPYTLDTHKGLAMRVISN